MTKKRPEVKLSFNIGTYDIDFAGVVSNIVYIRWLEDLRTAMLTKYLPLDELMQQGIAPTLGETNIQYRKPLRLFDRPQGRMWLAAVDGKWYTLEAEITINGKLVAAAKQRGVFVSLKEAKSIEPPERFVKLLEELEID